MSQMTLGQILQAAVAHHQAGRLAEAEGLYRQILARHPNQVDALNLLGVLATQAGKVDIGIDLLRRALAAKSDFPGALCNLATALIFKGQADEAIACLHRALALEPNSAAATFAMGNAKKEKGELDESIGWYEKALALQPTATAYTGLAKALAEMGRLEEALSSYERALALAPSMAEAHLGHALVLLRRGRYAEGWREYEWRWKCPERLTPRRELPGERWDGSDLKGRRILLYGEQGMGDVLQFIRYATLVARRGGRVVVDCQGDLRRLARGVEGVEEVVAWGEPLPAAEAHGALLSLPGIFGTTVENVPWEGPYLRAEVEEAKGWRERMDGSAGVLKVGLAWAGSAKNRNDRERSVELAALAPLAEVRGVRFFSLQKGEAARQSVPAEMEIVDWTQDLADFADTAALMENLDLVITVETAVAHLAGAMGKRVWMMTPWTDWRWLEGRSDSPWYPTMRIFRQQRRGDWEAVIREVREALAGMINDQSNLNE